MITIPPVTTKTPIKPPNITHHHILNSSITEGVVLVKNNTRVLAINVMPMDNTVAGYGAPNALAAVLLIGAWQAKSTPIRKAAKR